MSLGGVLIFTSVVAEPAFRLARIEPHQVNSLLRHLTVIAWTSLGIAITSGALWLALQTLAMSGLSLGATFSQDTVMIVLTRTLFGHVMVARCGVAIATTGVLFVRSRRRRGALTTLLDGILALLGATLSFSLAWTGHAAADEGMSGIIHAAADAAHMLAATAWLGGLVPLALLLTTARRNDDPTWIPTARTAINHFSAIGIMSVATLLITGAVNTWFLAGNVPALIGTSYGQWLLVKIALFLIMIGIAAVNRFRLTPRLSHVLRGNRARASQDAVRQLGRNAYIEAAFGVAVVLIVGKLGTLTPGLHMLPSWPLPFRFASELLSSPEIDTTVAIQSGVFFAGLILMVGGIALRRSVGSLQWPAFTVGLMMSFYTGVHLGTLIVPAYPTSFRLSPTGYTVGSIDEGRNLFSEHCVACHGSSGRGDGPLAKTLTIPPADLTADHIYAHLDGDLFWWVSNGIANVMPGFSAILDDRQRWSLIDYIHANADAIRLAVSPSQPSARYIPAPDFTAQCPDGSTISVRQLRGRIVHLVFVGAASADRMRRLAQLDLVGGDVTTIVVADHATSFESSKFCIAPGFDATGAYALYLGLSGTPPEESEFVIDYAGSLRAGWYPALSRNDAENWKNASVIRAVVESIRRNPLAPRTATTHVHAQ